MITGEDHALRGLSAFLLHCHSRHVFKSLLNIVSHNKQESWHPSFLKVNLDCPTDTVKGGPDPTVHRAGSRLKSDIPAVP